MLTDFHVHLRPDECPSTPPTTSPPPNAERYRETAAERGIEQLGVSEHVHRFTQALDVWGHPWWQHWARGRPRRVLRFVREETDLRLGIEADFLPGREDRLANLLDGRPWDYVLGSRALPGRPRGGRPRAEVGGLGHLAPRDPEKVWRGHFETLGERPAAACSTSSPTPTW